MYDKVIEITKAMAKKKGSKLFIVDEYQCWIAAKAISNPSSGVVIKINTGQGKSYIGLNLAAYYRN